jgi:retron-type reverse transcriptase
MKMSETNSIRLHMFGLPLVQTIEDLSKITHISKYSIYQLSKNSTYYYKTYTILKKSGKPRIISQPSKNLKGLQSWILVNILNKLTVSSSCKGFEKGTSTGDNAAPHVGANTLLTIDLKDFFTTVKQKQIFQIFKAIGYNNLFSTVFTNICTYENYLPQGSPCSPKLANLSTWQLDVRIQGYVGKRGINYTRYADDMSFSGLSPIKVVQVIPMIKKIVEDENFQINPSKTRIAGSSRAKIITGLVLSDGSFGIGKQKYKNVRAKIHHLTLPQEQMNNKLLYEVSGWLSYLNSVDKKRLNQAIQYINKLAIKHPATLITQLYVLQKKDEGVNVIPIDNNENDLAVGISNINYSPVILKM